MITEFDAIVQDIKTSILKCRYCNSHSRFYIKTHDCEESMVCLPHLQAYLNTTIQILDRGNRIKCSECKTIFNKLNDFVIVKVI